MQPNCWNLLEPCVKRAAQPDRRRLWRVTQSTVFRPGPGALINVLGAGCCHRSRRCPSDDPISCCSSTVPAPCDQGWATRCKHTTQGFRKTAAMSWRIGYAAGFDWTTISGDWIKAVPIGLAKIARVLHQAGLIRRNVCADTLSRCTRSGFVFTTAKPHLIAFRNQ